MAVLAADKARVTKAELGTAVLSLVIVLYVLRTGAVLVGDSQEYIEHLSIRPPLVPWLLDLSRLFIGPQHYLTGMAVFQTLLLMASAHFLCRELRRAFSLDGLGTCGIYVSVVFVMATTPILGMMGSQILSDSVAYALFLTHIALLIPCLQEHHPRRAAALMVAAINILSREQMVFAFLVTAIFVVALHRRGKQAAFKMLLLATLCLACVFLVNGAYHKAAHGSFSGPSWQYPHLWASLIFVSEYADVAVYADDPEYPVIERIFRYAQEDRLFAHYRRQDAASSMSNFYRLNMPRILFTGILNEYKKYGDPLTEDELFARASAASRRHFPVLLARKLPQFAQCFAIRLVQSCGVLDAFLVFSFLVVWRAAPRSPIALALGLALAMLLANILLVGLLNHLNSRYTMYTTALSMVACVLFACHLRRHHLRFVPVEAPGA